jgi:hypothetical protein
MLSKRANRLVLLKTSILLSHYKLIPFKEGYKFINSSGDEYYAYFTPFTLQASETATVETFCFGFECKKLNPGSRQVYDEATKITIANIIKNYFESSEENAILYVCLNNDKMARHRNVIFGKWFSEFGKGYERHKSKIETEKLDSYSSIIVKENNPNKQAFINAFHFTIDYWFPQSQ